MKQKKEFEVGDLVKIIKPDPQGRGPYKNGNGHVLGCFGIVVEDRRKMPMFSESINCEYSVWCFLDGYQEEFFFKTFQLKKMD